MTTQARELAKLVTNAGDVNLGDDISLASDGAILNFGADNDVTLTHVADTGLLLNSSRQIQFGDSGTHIRQSADGVLQLTSDTEVEINATTVDINANVDISGNLVLGGNITIGDADSDDISFGGELTSHIVPNADDTYDLGSSTKQWRNLYVDGSAYIDTIDGTDETTITNTDTGSSAGPIVSLYRNSSSAADADYLGQFKFQGENDNDQQVNYAKITGKILDASDGSEDGILEFAHIKAGSQTITGRWRSDSLQLLNGTSLVVAGLTYPTSDGSNGQFLKTDGSGTLSFATVSTSVALDDIATGDAASTLATSSGAITLDTPSSITLDSDSGVIDFDDGGTNIGRFENASSDFKMEARVQDKDIVFVGNDGGTGVEMLKLDASDAGTAIFNHDINLKDNAVIDLGDATEDFQIYHIGGSINVIRGNAGLVLQSDDTSYGIQMGSHSGGETMFKALKNGGVTLYNDNEEKLGTNDKGIVVASTGSKDVTIGMSNGDMDWHLGIDDSAGDHFKIGKHTGMGNNTVYSVTPGYKHEWQGVHQGDSTGHFRFSNSDLGDATNANCSLAVINGGTFLQVMAWATLGARIGTRTGGWNSTGSQGTYLVAADATNIICTSGGSPTLANGTAISSDQRLKKDITDIGDGQLAKINALKPRTFKWKDTRKTGTQEGFIAQEVESVMPEAVEEREVAPDPDDTTRDFGNDIKVLKHEVINARLIKAVQELSAELDAAKARITTLEG